MSQRWCCWTSFNSWGSEVKYCCLRQWPRSPRRFGSRLALSKQSALSFDAQRARGARWVALTPADREGEALLCDSLCAAPFLPRKPSPLRKQPGPTLAGESATRSYAGSVCEFGVKGLDAAALAGAVLTAPPRPWPLSPRRVAREGRALGPDLAQPPTGAADRIRLRPVPRLTGPTTWGKSTGPRRRAQGRRMGEAGCARFTVSPAGTPWLSRWQQAD